MKNLQNIGTQHWIRYQVGISEHLFYVSLVISLVENHPANSERWKVQLYREIQNSFVGSSAFLIS